MLLAFDTAQEACSVALGRGPSAPPLGISRKMRRGHADALLGMIADLLAEAGATMADIESIVCGIGPGSFTGVRVAVSAARGLALALAVPVAGFSSLEILAAAAGADGTREAILAAIASRDETVYVQRFAPSGRPLSAPALLDTAAAVRLAGGTPGLIVGSGAPRLAACLTSWPVIESPRTPPAEALLALAAAAPAERWRTPPVPLYLRPPDAEPPGPALAGARR